MHGRHRHPNAVDRGMLHLVRLVLDEEWSEGVAAARLRALVPDALVLRLMSVKAERALEERRSVVAERAVLTLRAAAVQAAHEDAVPLPA